MNNKIELSFRTSILVLLTCFFNPDTVFCQNREDSSFRIEKSWDKVLQKASLEKKLILVDAFATWCGPCKMMDKEVYSDPRVSEEIKRNFVGVKVQFDRTLADDEVVKSWYGDVELLKNKYHVEAFPTFLFINPDGTLAYRGLGYQNIDDFMKLMKDASIPDNNYGKNISLYLQRMLFGEALLKLANQAAKFKEDSLAREIAKTYKRQSLDNRSASSFLSPELAEYLASFSNLFSSKDPISKILFEHPDSADILLARPGLSKWFTENVVYREIISPSLKHNDKYSLKEPDWEKLERQIRNKYNQQVAETTILNAKLEWFNDKKDWNNIIKYTIEKTDLGGPDTVGISTSFLNNMVYNLIFKRGTDTWALKKGVSYMELLLTIAPEKDTWLDTYANLLYKLGRKKEAIKHEKKALQIARKRNDKEYEGEYLKTIKMIEMNQPTWPINE